MQRVVKGQLNWRQFRVSKEQLLSGVHGPSIFHTLSLFPLLVREVEMILVAQIFTFSAGNIEIYTVILLWCYIEVVRGSVFLALLHINFF